MRVKVWRLISLISRNAQALRILRVYIALAIPGLTFNPLCRLLNEQSLQPFGFDDLKQFCSSTAGVFICCR